MLNGNSVNGILKTFTKTIDKLEALQETEKNNADSCGVKILELENRQAIAKQEANRAGTVAGKLRGIIEA